MRIERPRADLKRRSSWRRETVAARATSATAMGCPAWAWM